MKKLKQFAVLGLVVSLGMLAAQLFVPQHVQAAAAAFQRARVAAVLFFNSTGVQRWAMSLDSSNNLQFVENTNVNGATVKINTATGGLAPRSRTLAQILATTPGSAGEILWNSSGNTLCVSSGTTPGAWIVLAAGDSVKIACK